MGMNQSHPAQLVHHQFPSEHRRIRHGSLLRWPSLSIPSAMDRVGQPDSSASEHASRLRDSTLQEPRVETQPTPADASLLGLPVELQKTILEYLSTNADKKNVCLTCKEMQTLVTPLLYKDMEIFAERLDQTLFTTLKAGHLGLPQVQTLCIRSLEKWTSGSISSRGTLQAEVVCHLLNAIPRHSLTRVEIPNLSYGCAGIYFASRLRQAKACNYQHRYCLCSMSEDGYLDWNMIAPGVDELAHVTSLQIFLPLDEPEHLNQAGSLVDCTPALRSLDLELEKREIFEDDNCCDGAVSVVESIFGTGNETKRTITLKTLRITSMCLLLAGELLTTVVELKNLKHLQLVRCQDINPLLRGLEPLRLTLSSLSIEDCCEEYSTDFATNDFIRSVAPLKRLTLKCSSTRTFDQSTLQTHCDSLRSLLVEGDPEEDPSVMTLGNAPRLEQLALSGFRHEDEWFAKGPEDFYDLPDLSEILEPLKSLEVLKLTMHCTSLDRTDTPTQMMCMPRVLRTVRGAAEKIFALNLPKLTAVVFVIEGERYELLTHNRFAFLLSKQLGQDGVMRSSVVQVEPHMVKHHVPCADILEPDKFVFA